MGEIEKYLLNLIIREKKLLLAGMSAGLILFLIYFLFFYTPLYTSTSNLYIKNIIKANVIASFPDSGTIRSESGYSNPLFNLYELIKSENIAFRLYEQVKDKYPRDIGRLGVTTKDTFFRIYLKLVTSEVIPSTDVLRVSLEWPDRENAQKVLSIIIDEFRRENLQIRRSLDTQKRVYLEDQTEEIANQLETLREEIKNYKIKNKLSDADNEALNLADIRLGIIREISMLKAQIDYNTRKFNELARQLNINDPIVALKAAGVGNDPHLVSLSQDLARAQQTYARLRTKFTDKYHEVISVRGEIEGLKQAIEERKLETTQDITLPRQIYDGPSTDIVSQFAQVHIERLSQEEMLKTLKSGINEILEKEKDLHIKQIGLASLEKQEEAFAAAYQNIKAKQLEAKIKENEIVDNILTLKSPTRASSLQIALFTRLLGFILLGGLAGLGIAYIKQGIEDKWSDINELKRITEQDILGVIPWLRLEDNEKTDRIYDAAYTNIASEIITKACFNNASILSFIATNLYSNKSVIINNVGKFLTTLEKTSIIIDFSQDFPQESDLKNVVNLINQKLKSDGTLPENKIMELIREAVVTEEFKRDGEVSHLYRLGIDKVDSNLKYFVSNGGFSVLLDILKREFDFVLINTPHGNFTLPEINLIKKKSEAIVLIASMDSSKEELVRLVSNIKESKQKILGIITREKNTEIERFFSKKGEEA